MSVGYNDSQLKNKPAITLNIEVASLENALAQILKGTGFTYQLKEKYIMIIPEQKKESNPTKKITGKVVDENNDPFDRSEHQSGRHCRRISQTSTGTS